MTTSYRWRSREGRWNAATSIDTAVCAAHHPSVWPGPITVQRRTADGWADCHTFTRMPLTKDNNPKGETHG